MTLWFFTKRVRMIDDNIGVSDSQYLIRYFNIETNETREILEKSFDSQFSLYYTFIRNKYKWNQFFSDSINCPVDFFVLSHYPLYIYFPISTLRKYYLPYIYIFRTQVFPWNPWLTLFFMYMRYGFVQWHV